jgi:hypothetical protein
MDYLGYHRRYECGHVDIFGLGPRWELVHISLPLILLARNIYSFVLYGTDLTFALLRVLNHPPKSVVQTGQTRQV